MRKLHQFIFILFILCSHSFAQVVNTISTTPQPTANINPCYNLGFESVSAGSYSSIPSWTIGTGSYTNGFNNGYCLNYPLNNTVTPQVGIISFPITTAICNTITSPNSPFAGSKALFMGSEVSVIGLQRAERTFSVTTSNPYLEYAYIFCISRAHSNCCDASYLKIGLFDQLGNSINCGSVTINGANPTNTACLNLTSINTATTMFELYTTNWVINTFDLTNYVGTNVTIKLEVGSCGVGGHHARILYDSQCLGSLIQSNGTISGNTITACGGSGTATLTTVSANSFTWNGPSTSSITNISSSTITTSVSGVYTLSIYNANCATSKTYTYSVNICNPSTNIIGYENNNLFSVYPNPSNGSITIQSTKKVELFLTDLTGKCLESILLDEKGQFKKQIDHLSKGVYLLQAENFRQKIIVLE